jgi:putative FmdB family regulatory protein
VPYYEYKCAVCRENYVLKLPVEGHARGACPNCGVVGDRVFTAVPVHYKGEGFYVTDYKQKGR